MKRRYIGIALVTILAWIGLATPLSILCEFTETCSGWLLWLLQKYPGKLFVPEAQSIDSMVYLADTFGFLVGGVLSIVLGYILTKLARRRTLQTDGGKS